MKFPIISMWGLCLLQGSLIQTQSIPGVVHVDCVHNDETRELAISVFGKGSVIKYQNKK